MDEVKKIVRYKLSKLLTADNYSKVTDADIEFVLARAKALIQGYCHRTDMPEGLYYTWVDMAIEFMKDILKPLFEKDTTSEEELAKRITSVRAGDTTINMEAGSSDDTIDTGYNNNSVDANILFSFAKQLQSYRKFSAGCGKDLHGI
nr:head-tail adaptor [Caudoviricetes sp.]